jgi:hypothetical protein
MRLVLSGFFDAVQARPQTAALFMHEALGDAPIAVPAGAEGFIGLVRSLYEQGQAEGVFAVQVPFWVAYSVAIGTLIAMSVFAPRFPVPDSVKPGFADDPELLRDQVVGQVLSGLTG